MNKLLTHYCNLRKLGYDAKAAFVFVALEYCPVSDARNKRIQRAVRYKWALERATWGVRINPPDG